MARAWELRLHARWWARALLGFGLAGLVLNSLLAWLVYATFSTAPFASFPPSQRFLAWVVYLIGPRSGPRSPQLAPLGLDPLELLSISLTLAAAIGITYATLRERHDPEPGVETTDERALRFVLPLASLLLPFPPIVALGWFLFRLLSRPLL